ERVAPRGNLGDLLRVLDNERTRLADARGFADARGRFQALEREILRIEDAGDRIPRQARRLGRRLAANLASAAAVVAIALLVAGRIAWVVARGATRGRSRRPGRRGGAVFVVAGLAVLAPILFATPAFIVFSVGMIPALVALVVDREPARNA